MKNAFCLALSITGFLWCSPVSASVGVEKVNIYLGHFLLQSWPKDNRIITMEIDTTFPPDTLVFQAIAGNGGLKSTTLQIRDMQGNVIEELSRVTRLEDETEATFIYVVSPANVRKIKGRRFCVVLDSHQAKDSEVHNVALILLDNKQ